MTQTMTRIASHNSPDGTSRISIMVLSNNGGYAVTRDNMKNETINVIGYRLTKIDARALANETWKSDKSFCQGLGN